MAQLKSDSDLTMYAKKIFDDMIDKVKNSMLNYHLQLSPFSAHISLKRSLQKDRTGASIMLPSVEYESEETIVSFLSTSLIRLTKN